MADFSDTKNSAQDTSTTVRGSNQSGMRAHNERLTLSLLRSRGPMPKAEVARITGLSAQTVSVIMRSLEADGLLERCEPVRGKVGQPSIPMKLAPEGALFFGLKVGRRSSNVVLVNFLGQTIANLSRTYIYPTPEDTIQFALDCVNTMSAQLSPAQRKRISGFGVAIPFQMWNWNRSIGAPEDKIGAWHDLDIHRELSEKLDFPIYIENDATSACGAELVFGSPERLPDFLYFFVGYFIGGGVVLNNSLFAGATGNAGALGSMRVPVADQGFKQLIDVASLSGLERLIQDSGQDSEGLWKDTVSWDVDPELLETWLDRAALGIANAILSACSVIDFEMVMVDGWLPAHVRHRLTDLIQKYLMDLDLSGLNPPSIREGTIGANARALGAASLPLSKRFLVGPGALPQS